MPMPASSVTKYLLKEEKKKIQSKQSANLIRSTFSGIFEFKPEDIWKVYCADRGGCFADVARLNSFFSN